MSKRSLESIATGILSPYCSTFYSPSGKMHNVSLGLKSISNPKLYPAIASRTHDLMKQITTVRRSALLFLQHYFASELDKEIINSNINRCLFFGVNIVYRACSIVAESGTEKAISKDALLLSHYKDTFKKIIDDCGRSQYLNMDEISHFITPFCPTTESNIREHLKRAFYLHASHFFRFSVYRNSALSGAAKPIVLSAGVIKKLITKLKKDLLDFHPEVDEDFEVFLCL